MKTKLLFIINQFFKGGAEMALLNLFHALPPERYEIDFLIFDHIDLPGTIPLLPELPKWIHVMNPAKNEGSVAFLKKGCFRLCRTVFHRQPFRKGVIDCLKGKRYDVAVSFGEWFSSRLAAEYVKARRKYVWIHSDMDKTSFLHPDILTYQQCFDRFLFASARSMDDAEKEYPILRGRGIVVHNLVDEVRIRRRAVVPLEAALLQEDNMPILVTIANLRPEKNHLRQIRVMKQLVQRGIRFLWLNAGNLANPILTGQVRSAVEEAGLADSFRLLGAVENPYPLMKRAAAVCVLSDYESWSMVITEAKALRVPVIATRTSGAVEQLVHMETGVLCDFNEEDIADRIGSFLAHPEQGERIRANLQGFSAQADTLERLEPLLRDDRRKIAYLFDDVNYLSGARNAALAQMESLSSFAEMVLFSAEPCQDETLKAKFRQLDLMENKGLRCFSTSSRAVLKGREYSWKWKLIRLLYTFSTRLGREQYLPQLLLKRALPPLLSGFDSVCVVSEASRLRRAVSTLEGPKKVQWIHTDYAAWRERSAWTKAVTRYDADLYSRFDTIVCLSEGLREKFAAIYPHLREKTTAISNFIQIKEIRQRAAEPLEIPVDPKKYNLITIGRMEPEKRYDLILKTASELKGIAFCWYLVGDGPLLPELKESARRLEVLDVVSFTGRMDNPYPLMKQCDALVLMSDYEGTPVTVDEAKVLGVPILSRDVGGVRDQLNDERLGRIILDSENAAGIIDRFIRAGSSLIFQCIEFNCYNNEIQMSLRKVFD